MDPGLRRGDVRGEASADKSLISYHLGPAVKPRDDKILRILFESSENAYAFFEGPALISCFRWGGLLYLVANL